MKPFHSLALALALCCALASTGWAQTAKPGQPIVLNFVNADIEAVARTLAGLTGRNLVVDPRVKGSINLSTEKPVSPAVAWDQFLATLRLQGFSMVVSNGLYKVVPEAEAKLQGGGVTEVPNPVGTPPAPATAPSSPRPKPSRRWRPATARNSPAPASPPPMARPTASAMLM